MFAVPINSTLGCKAYYTRPELQLPKFLVIYAVAKCLEDLEGEGMGTGGGYGVDLFITAVANEYFHRAAQIMVVYDESWDITEMLIKLESQSRKSLVTYYLPSDGNKSLHADTRPPDHITHKLLPKAKAFLVFVRDEDAFINILETMSRYPWWDKRAKVLIMVKDRAMEPSKGILELLESEKIFNGVVVTEFAMKDNSTGNLLLGNSSIPATNTTNTVAEEQGMELQVVALDPYPLPGHSKQSFVARWKNKNYTAFVRPIFAEKIDNLRGNTLVACVFEFPPLVIKKEISPGKFHYYGQEVKLFQEFAQILNFTYEFYEPPAGERWGENIGNNTWTGLIGETQRKADFGFASIFLLDNREMAVDVSNPYDQDQGCFAVPRPEALKTWAGLILPFSWQVWACILGMAFVAGPIFSGITRPLRMDSSISVGRGIFYALGSLVSAQKAPQAKSHSLRTFIVVWLIFCWLSFILYRVSLIVSLTTGPSNFKLDTLRQLINSGLEWGGYIEVLKTFSNSTLAEKSKKNEKSDQKMFDRYQEVLNMTAALDRVADEGDFAVLDSRKFLLYAAKGAYFDGYGSALHIMKECPTRYNVGFAMPIGSPFLDRINELIRRLQSAGLIDKWLSDILHEAALKTPAKDKKRRRDRALSLDNMKLLFIIFFGGHFCAFISFCVENGIIEYKARKVILVRLARKLSVISAHFTSTPSVVITDTDPNIKPQTDGERQKEKEAEASGKMAWLQPPPDPDAILYDDQDLNEDARKKEE